MKVCAVIPAYNEADQISNVIRGILPIVSRVIVVDDGSKDRTEEIAKKAGAVVKKHPKNLGKGAAIETGIKAALNSDCDAFILMDADAQHDWEEIPLFVKKMKQSKAGIVIGNRMRDTQKMPLIRKWTNQFTSWVVSKLCRQKIEDSQCGFRLVSKKVVEDVDLSLSRFDAESEFLILAARAGHKIDQVQIKTIYRGDEVSKIHPVVDTIRFFKMVWKYRKK